MRRKLVRTGGAAGVMLLVGVLTMGVGWAVEIAVFGRGAWTSASTPSTLFTEDTDTNDGGTPNNVPDEGDNQHPSGNDRSVESGGSGNQGNAHHDPDDDGNGPDRTNGGLDQPNGPGGDDLADQDANNGCGNDDDFEDDSEGQCGGYVGAQVPNRGRSDPGKPQP